MEGVAKETAMCVICEVYDRREKLTCVTSKGLSSLKEASMKRQENHKINKFVDNFHVHESCRKDYVAQRKIRLYLKKKNSEEESNQKQCAQLNNTRKTSSISNSSCILCSSSNKKDKENIAFVQSEKVEQSIRSRCKSRCDNWSIEVLSNITAIGNLYLNKTWYHINCYQCFLTDGKKKPRKFNYEGNLLNVHEGVKRKSEELVGKPVDAERSLGFSYAMKHLEENDEKLITVKEFCQVMDSYGCEPYSIPYMKTKLIETYKDNIQFYSKEGSRDLICLTHSCDKIIQELHSHLKEAKSNPEKEKFEIISTAAKFLIQDIKRMDVSMESYDFFSALSSSTESLSFVPLSLQMLL